MIEFAFILPVLLLVFLGAVEITRFVMINQKVTAASNTMSSYISQMRFPDNAKAPLNANIKNAFDAMLAPFDPLKGGFIVTSLSKNSAGSTTLQVNWSQSFGTVGISQVPDAVKDLASQIYPSQDNDAMDTVIAVESFYNYENIIPGASFFSSALNFDKTIYQRSTLLARVMPRPQGNNLASVPNPTGCCGSYCNDPPSGVRCRFCYIPGSTEKAMCATTAAAEIKYKLPRCLPSCPPPQPCTPSTKACRCNPKYCNTKKNTKGG
ncbi:MAG: TadE/TadG family type IV pilus assembly protein [Rickettsiales bacterium]